MQTDTSPASAPDAQAAALGNAFADLETTPAPTTDAPAEAVAPAADAPPPPPPKPRPTKAAKVPPPQSLADSQAPATPSPSLRAFGAQLAAALPGAERVEIYKLATDGPEAGHEGGIGVWQSRDILREASAMSFLLKYVTPTFGPGAYHFWAINAQGKRVDAGWERVAEPSVTPAAAQQIAQTQQQNDATGILSKHLDETRSELKELRRATMQPQQQPNQLASVREFHETAKLLGMEGKQANEYVASMVQASQRQTGLEPMMAATLERISMRVEALAEKVAAASSAPMPPPMPPPDPNAGLAPVLSAMIAAQGEMMKVLLTPRETAPAFGLKEALELINATKPPAHDAFTPDKALGFMADAMKLVKPEAPAVSDFKSRMQELVMMMRFGRMASGGDGGGASLNDVILKLIDAKPGSLGYAVASRLAETPPAKKQLPAKTPRTAAPANANAQPTAQPPAPAPAQTAPASAPPADAPPAGTPPEAPPAAAPPKPKAPRPWPNGIEDAASHLNAADTDPDRIGAFLDMLQFLGTTDWKPYARVLLRKAIEDEKNTVLREVDRLLTRLVGDRLVTVEAGKATFAAIHNQWGQIVEQLRVAVQGQLEDDDDGFGDEIEDAPRGEPPQEVIDAPADDDPSDPLL